MNPGSNYKLSDVLGAHFRDFVRIAESDDGRTLNAFLYENALNKDLPSSAGAKDIYYSYPNWLIAAAAGFKRIDPANLATITTTNRVYNDLASAAPSLFAPGASLAGTTRRVALTQGVPLPYRSLVPGIIGVSADDLKFDNALVAPVTAAGKVIGIALAPYDLTNVDATAVISALKSNPEFTDIRQAIIDAIKTNPQFADPTLDGPIQTAVDGGLTSIARRFIDQNRIINPSGQLNNAGIDVSNMATLDAFVGGDNVPLLKAYLNGALAGIPLPPPPPVIGVPGAAIGAAGAGAAGAGAAGLLTKAQADNIIAEIDALGVSPEKKIILKSLLFGTVERNGNVSKADIDNILQSTYDYYPAVDARLNAVKATTADTYKQDFINGFSVGSRGLAYGPTGYGAAGAAGPKTSNLVDPEIMDFFKNEVVPNKAFYERFFNVVRVNNGAKVSFNDTDIEINPGAYRLNALKYYANALIGGLRMNGGDPNLSDLAFAQVIPNFPFSGITGIWLDRNQQNYVSAADINRGLVGNPPNDALLKIFRDSYATSGDALNILGKNISQTNAIQTALSVPGANINFNNLLSAADSSLKYAGGPIAYNQWINGEYKLRSYLNRYNSEWRRNGHDFVRYKDGAPVASMPADSCAMIKNSTSECLQTLEQCLGGSGTANCTGLLNLSYEVNASLSSIRDQIIKMNPKIALAILNKLHFGSYLSDHTDTYHGLRYRKVQDVGDWIKEWMEGNKCDPSITRAPVPGCETLRQMLGQPMIDVLTQMVGNKAKHGFFNYLDVLVQYVNSIPQLLNPEFESAPDQIGANYPEPNKDNRLYQWENPNDILLKGIHARTVCQEQELQRLKASLIKGTKGLDARALLGSVYNTPSGMSFPLNRASFSTTLPIDQLAYSQGLQFNPGFTGLNGFTTAQSGLLPLPGFIGLRGGHYDSLEDKEQGSYLLTNTYEDLLKSLGAIVINRNVNQINPASDQKIRNALDNLKAAEETLRDEIKTRIKAIKILELSQGYINPFNKTDAELDNIYAKYLGPIQSQANVVNTNALGVINYLIKIAQTVSSKAGTALALASPSIDHGRPLGAYSSF
jgi:hypothetical protein